MSELRPTDEYCEQVQPQLERIVATADILLPYDRVVRLVQPGMSEKLQQASDVPSTDSLRQVYYELHDTYIDDLTATGILESELASLHEKASAHITSTYASACNRLRHYPPFGGQLSPDALLDDQRLVAYEHAEWEQGSYHLSNGNVFLVTKTTLFEALDYNCISFYHLRVDGNESSHECTLTVIDNTVQHIGLQTYDAFNNPLRPTTSESRQDPTTDELGHLEDYLTHISRTFGLPPT